VDISAGRAATKDTGAALDNQAEAPAVRQVESSRNDDNLQQSETESVVPEKTVVGTRVLVMLIIALLVVLAVFFALRHSKWRAWQDEITNWWADFSVTQTMLEAQSLEPQLDERLVM
jgi:hypothetical protein